MLDKKVFKEGMALLCEVFREEVSELFLKAYYQTLRDMTNRQFEDAIQKILRTETFHKIPLPAQFFETFNGDVQTKTQQALAKVEKAVDRYGPYYSIVFDDPIIHIVVDRLGGWEWLTTQTHEQWVWIRKDFEKLYQIYSKMNVSQLEIPERLIGITEKENSASGFDEDTWQKMIIYYGDEQKIFGWQGKEQIEKSGIKMVEAL